MAVRASSSATHATVSDDFAGMAERLRRSTVHVRSGEMGGGSGVIWRADGLIVTNAHVARTPRATVELWDGRTFDGAVIASDPRRDLAAITIPAADLPAAPAGDSDALRVGQLVVAVGNPLGLTGALTVGILHAIAPSEPGERQTWVQADVDLAPGNSGGPLADVQGRILGINSMVAGGLGLAVPSNAVARFLLVRESRPRLGVTIQPVVLPVAGRRTPGLLVLQTEAGSPAEEAGIMIGDCLIGAGGRAFNQSTDLGHVLEEIGADGTVQLDLVRGGTRLTRTIVLSGGKGDTKEAA